MNKEELKTYLVETRHALHKIPEVGADLPKTMEFVTGELDKMGIGYKVVERGGIFGTLGKGERVLLLRADMDALPVEEQSGEEFASTNGNMHACGHDMHTTMLLGAAKILKEKEDELNCKVILFFECDEERGVGMHTINEKKVLEELGITGALALHCLPGNGLLPGTYICHEGPPNSSIIRFKVKVKGKTAHGATPHMGKNPIHGAVQIYNEVMGIIPWEVDARRCTLTSICFFNAGTPEVGNIIPETAEFGGTIRSHATEDGEYVFKRICEIAEHTAKALNMESEVKQTLIHPAALNSKEMTELVNECAAKCGMTNLDLPPQMVSDPFGFITEKYSGAYVWIGVSGEEEKYRDGILHNPKVCFDDRTLPYGAELLSEVALNYR